MATRRIPGVRNISRKEVRELSKLPWVRDEALSSRGMEARALPDGRVFLFHGDDCPGVLFPSREGLAEARRASAEDAKRQGPTVDLSETLLPPIVDFLRDVEAHAKSVGKVLRIPDEALDFTEPSLDAIDAALKRIRPAAKRMTPEIVTPVIAYLGEVMRRVSGGQWTQRTTNEPLIKARDGRLLQPFSPVVLPMVEPSRRMPLRAAVEVYLLPYRGAEGAGAAASSPTT
jgi:hypothetical protein